MKRRIALGAVLVAVLALGAVWAFAAPQAGASGTTAPAQSMTVLATGQKQGVFTKTPIPLLSLSHEIVVPRDSGSPYPAGRQQHMPISMTMLMGPTTPRFLTALTTSEILTSVQISLVRSGTKVATIKLTNARVAHYVETDQTVQFDLTYERIEWTWLAGGLTAQDYWINPAA
ncbi:MAG TPA: type VI secretion system tube protein Hcp [Gaiellaceae bacterium]